MMRNASLKRGRRGFSLVELAIVLAIIGILASTAGAQYIQFLERARMARVIVELKGIAISLDSAKDDETPYPTSLADAGSAANDPWGNAYQFLRIEGDLPPGMARTDFGLPHVAARPSGDESVGGPPAIGLARKDRFLVPINSDYDLYSMGPDGESKATLNAPVSRDDIIRAADGAFYGIAENF